MSGFEIVGVILGVYPLVASALTCYKATRGGKGAASLSLSLKIESIIFDEFVYKLLAPNAFQDEQVRRKVTSSSDLDLWKDPLLQEHIKSRLGSRKAEVVVEILEQIKALLSSLELEFSPIPNEHTIVSSSCMSKQFPDFTANFQGRSFFESFVLQSAM